MSKVAGSASDGPAGSRAAGDAAPVVCVFCGASAGKSPLHLEAARELAKLLHANGIKLVYGGGTAGIMGEVAKTLVALSGPEAVHGIIPKALVRFERASSTKSSEQGLSSDAEASSGTPPEAEFGRTTVVPDMHTRKQLMAQDVIRGGPGSGFVALSGGYGTMEELMEVTTWNQLGIHSRPIVVFNVDGYYDGLIQWVRNAVKNEFIASNNGDIMVEAKSSEEVWQALQTYRLSKGRFELDWSSN